MITVDNLEILKALQNHEEGEVALVKDTNQVYTYQNEGWHLVDDKLVSEGGLKMNLYELNKSIISQQEPLDNQKLNDFKDTINAKYSNLNYILLYGQEIRYFTLFKKIEDSKEDSLGQCVLDCVRDINEKIYSFEILDNGAMEIWVHNALNGLATVLYLFDYEEGVVPFNG